MAHATPPGNDPDTELCTYCPKLCRHACPVSAADTREALITQQKMQALGDLRTGKRDFTADNALPIYGCTGCGMCTAYCAHEVPVARTLLGARAELRTHGVAHPALANLPERHAARDRALSAALLGRFPVGDFASRPAAGSHSGEVGLLPGCDSCASEDGLGDVERTLALLRALGPPASDVKLVAIDAAGGPLCGGEPLHAGGETEALRAVAVRQADSLSRYQTVILTCPGCTLLMRDGYAQLGVKLAPKIVHLTEYLEPYVDRVAARRTPGAPATEVHYHDPCHLGRGLGVYEAPRLLLAGAGLTTKEFAWSRKDSQCSGGSGLLPLTMPETSRAMANRRLAEVEGEGPVRVVTACPTCKRSLSRAAAPTTTVDDLASVLARALGL